MSLHHGLTDLRIHQLKVLHTATRQPNISNTHKLLPVLSCLPSDAGIFLGATIVLLGSALIQFFQIRTLQIFKSQWTSLADILYLEMQG